ncbi:VENN motif pre-toxin domain-containing protein [Rahnella sp. FC061912-K]|nr:VENN motif pre-toxin domain-containing protein [Rahnella rivi]
MYLFYYKIIILNSGQSGRGSGRVAAISTLSAGLAGVITGDSSANAVEGAQAGNNALENNALSLPHNKARAHEITQCQGDSACEDAGELAGKRCC